MAGEASVTALGWESAADEVSQSISREAFCMVLGIPGISEQGGWVTFLLGTNDNMWGHPLPPDFTEHHCGLAGPGTPELQ